jgi:hypothetical protein
MKENSGNKLRSDTVSDRSSLSKEAQTEIALKKVLVKFKMTPEQIMMRFDKVRLKRAYS